MRMREVRYRTEAFSGTGERDAAAVMAFETFDLGNTDILEHLRDHILKDPALIAQCTNYIEVLEENCSVSGLHPNEGTEFFQTVLDSIEEETGVRVNYVLWLADKEAVTARDWYGRDMADDLDYDRYEVGPLVLSDLGYDGTLYGYTEMPVPLKERATVLHSHIDLANRLNEATARAQLTNITNREEEVSRPKEH